MESSIQGIVFENKRDTAEAYLISIRNNYLMSKIAISLLERENRESLTNIPFNQLGLLHPPNINSLHLNDFRKSSIRVLIREAFEVINEYAIFSTQQEKVFQEKWYHFTRLIRNCLAHDFRLNFSKKDMAERLPLVWNNLTLNKNMNGQYLPDDFLNEKNLDQLLTDMQNSLHELD